MLIARVSMCFEDLLGGLKRALIGGSLCEVTRKNLELMKQKLESEYPIPH
jgi:hypothetical protein